MYDDGLYAKQGQTDEPKEGWETYDDDVYIPEEYRKRKTTDVPLPHFGCIDGGNGNGGLIVVMALLGAMIGIIVSGALR